jgi:outer membrane protein assembly factor BamB
MALFSAVASIKVGPLNAAKVPSGDWRVASACYRGAMNLQNGRMMARWLCTALFTIQTLLMESLVLSGDRFATAPGGVWGASALIVFALTLGLSAIWGRRLWRRWESRLLAGTVALLPILRFDARYVLDAIETERVSIEAQAIIVFLRQVTVAQEQARLAFGRYVGASDSLVGVVNPATSRLHLTVHGASGWAATVTTNRASCTVWVRDTTLPEHDLAPEGTPSCGGVENKLHGHATASILAEPAERGSGFRASELVGAWTQHRGDARRSGYAIVTGPSQAVRWTTHVGGELRASAAVAGNQVFLGAHGNGELVALALDSGHLVYRVRVPGWIHHEPIVTADLVISGFGGSAVAPYGAAAFERASGKLRWIRYTNGSVMTAPVMHDSIVAIVSGKGEARAFRATDGAPVWSSDLRGGALMGNPLVVDTSLIVGLEPTSVCVLDVRTGLIRFCKVMAVHGVGAGHASVAVANGAVLATYHRIISIAEAVRRGYLREVVRHLLGIGRWNVSEQVLVAIDLFSGRERWRVGLGVGSLQTEGHTAGTPMVDGEVAYVSTPVTGEILAVRLDSGGVLWRAAVNPARGSLSAFNGRILAATTSREFVVLDQVTGMVRCRQSLQGAADRASLTITGSTGILTLLNGIVLARPMNEWLACLA